MEPANDALVTRQFYKSLGVNPWTPGKLSLLKAHASQASTSKLATLVFGAGASPKYSSDSLVGYVFGATGLGLTEGYKVVPASDRLSVTTTALSGWPGVTSNRPVACVGGGYVWVVSEDLTSCYAASLGSTTFAANITGMSSNPKGVWFAKGRMILADGANLFALAVDKGVGSSVALSTLTGSQISPSTAPDGTWKWTGCADAPGAILMAGYSAGSGSSIQKFTVTDAGGITTQSALTTVAQMPEGEKILNIDTYLGAYLIIVTNLGVRIGTVDDQGRVSYGPLSYEGRVSPTGAIGKYGSFFWVGVADIGTGSNVGLVRFDLSSVAEDGRCPWAMDVYSGTTSSGSPDVHGIWPMDADNLYFLCDDNLANPHTLQGPTANKVSSGYVESGWIRFNTLEKKVWHSARVQALGTALNGSVALAITDSTETTSTIGTYTTLSAISDPISLTAPTTPQQRVRVKLTLSRSGGDATLGPILDGWQIRALPSIKRQELVRVPLLCFDFERDERGVQSGYEGWAWARYLAVKSAAENMGLLTFQSFKSGETFTCVVDDLVFQEVSPPVTASGFGGVLTITVRSL